VHTRRRSVRTVGLIAMTCIAAAQAIGAGAPEDAVAAAEHQWLQAEQTNNADLIAPLLSDKVVVTTEEGKVLAGKVAVLTDARATTWTTAKYEDLKVSVFDQTAIATGTFIGKGADAGGKTFNVKLRFTDTWVRKPNGGWLCVAGHDSALGDR
jgi:ketosteroid isomerase-like protein